MKNRNLFLFIIASAFLGISQSIDGSIFNNFLNDTFHLTVSQRTILEFPRELPGFLVVFVSSFLISFGDIRIAAIANILAAIGMMALGFLSSGYGTMILWLTVYSMGQHLYLPVSNSIGMSLANNGNLGQVLGRINAVNTAAFLGTSLITAFIFSRFKVNYRIAFIFGAIAFIISAILIFSMTSQNKKVSNKKLLIRKEYSLFYMLSVVYGARKQIFITFGPWVLIKVFHQGVSTFAILGFIIAGIGIFFKPYIGYLIDKIGEKKVLAGEALALVVVCSGYAFSKSLYLVCACFVMDQLLVAVGMARSTYLKKIALSPDDVSPTLSMGISMDHVVAMIIPWLGGLLWATLGYEAVFIAGACIALVNFAITRGIKIEETAN